MQLIRLIIFVITVLYSFGLVAEQIRCNVDVIDINTVDRRLESLGCAKGDVLVVQFWVQPDGTLPDNESPSAVAAKNCDFSRQILIEKETLRIREALKEIHVLTCILDEYRGTARPKSEK